MAKNNPAPYWTVLGLSAQVVLGTGTLLTYTWAFVDGACSDEKVQQQVFWAINVGFFCILCCQNISNLSSLWNVFPLACLPSPPALTLWFTTSLLLQQALWSHLNTVSTESLSVSHKACKVWCHLPYLPQCICDILLRAPADELCVPF